jgi:hypothetical protein
MSDLGVEGPKYKKRKEKNRWQQDCSMYSETNLTTIVKIIPKIVAKINVKIPFYFLFRF